MSVILRWDDFLLSNFQGVMADSKRTGEGAEEGGKLCEMSAGASTLAALGVVRALPLAHVLQMRDFVALQEACTMRMKL